MSWDPTNLSLISSAELILSENLFHDDDDDDDNKYMMSTHSIHDVWNMGASSWVSPLLKRLEATVGKQRDSASNVEEENSGIVQVRTRSCQLLALL